MGAGWFRAVAAYCLLDALSGGGGTLSSLLLCAVGFATGVLARDSYLTSQVTIAERRVLAEFPVIAEMLALAVAAGESPVAALDRVVRRSGGELSRDLATVLAAVRTGEPVEQRLRPPRRAPPACPRSRGSRRASRSPSNAVRRSPTSSMPRPPTCARPDDAS